VLWPPTVKGRMIKSWFDHGRGMVLPCGRSGAKPGCGLVAALGGHECSADAGLPDRVHLRGVRRQLRGFPERKQRRDMRADWRLSARESVIDCSPRALVGPWRGRPA